MDFVILARVYVYLSNSDENMFAKAHAILFSLCSFGVSCQSSQSLLNVIHRDLQVLQHTLWFVPK
jgi:hypothetical protein